MSDSRRGQISRGAAEHYEQHFVPALFAQWAPRVAEAALVRAGDRVLDVACGTGVLARHLAGRVGATGSVVGLDANDGMLEVAARRAPEVSWREGRAEELPFEDGTFDAVVSQFGLMFFDDRPRAIREMNRVLRPGGRLAVAVWDSLEHSPGYAAVAALLERLFGSTGAEAIRMPFVLGDLTLLQAIFTAAGVQAVEIRTVPGDSRFPSIHAWMETEISGWTLRDVLGDSDRRRLDSEAETALGGFVGPGGFVAFSAPAHIVSAVKP